MDALLRDVKFAVRTLGRAPGFVLVAVVSLALGIGANSTFYSLVSAVQFRPLPYADADRLVDVSERNPEALCAGCAVGTSYPAYLDLRERVTAFEAVGAYREDAFALAGDGVEPERVSGTAVSASLLPLLGVAPAAGRAFEEGEDRPGAARVVILGHGLWQRRFGGDRSVVGRTLRVNGEPHTVVGVMPPRFKFPEFAELWVPLAPRLTDAQRAARDDRNTGVLARIADGVTPARAAAEAAALGSALAAEHPETQRGWSMAATRLRDDLVADSGPPFWLLLGASGFVLLIACANVAGLLLVRAAARGREMAIRVAAGAGRGHLVRQLLTESVLLAAAGGAGGLLLAMWGVDATTAAFAAQGIEVPGWIEPGVDWRVVAFTAALALGTGVLFGLAPALHASRPNVQDALREGGHAASAGARRARVGGALVVAEVALAVVLLAGAGLMARTYARVSRTDDLGYDPRGVLSAQARLLESRYDDPAQLRAFGAAALERLTTMAGVRAAALEHTEFLGTFDRPESVVRADGWPAGVPNESAPRFGHAVTPDYFALLGVRLLAGRALDARDGPGAPGAAVVTRAAAAALWPGQSPRAVLGRRLRLSADSAAPWLAVVGVAADPIGSPLGRSPLRAVYSAFAQRPGRPVAILVKAAGAAPLALAPALRAQVAAVDPDQPLDDVMTMEQGLARWVAPVAFIYRLLGGLAAVAILLAAVGVYGVMAYAVGQRTHEIGIRVALGARAPHLLRLVLGRGLALAGGGLLLGVAGALAITRVLRSILFGTDPADPLVLAAVGLLLAAVAAVASLLPARRALRVSPMVALRSE